MALSWLPVPPSLGMTAAPISKSHSCRSRTTGSDVESSNVEKHKLSLHIQFSSSHNSSSTHSVALTLSISLKQPSFFFSLILTHLPTCLAPPRTALLKQNPRNGLRKPRRRGDGPCASITIRPRGCLSEGTVQVCAHFRNNRWPFARAARYAFPADRHALPGKRQRIFCRSPVVTQVICFLGAKRDVGSEMRSGVLWNGIFLNQVR